MTKLDETGLFQHSEPRRDRCALCESRKRPFQFETRPTGPNFRRQPWAFCKPCYRTYVLGNGNGAGELAEALAYLVTAIFMGPGPEKVVDNEERSGAG
jgi:hypothetical protein